MNKAGKIAIGCLLAPIGLVAIVVFLFMAVRMAGVPEPRATTKTLEQPLASDARTARELESTRRTSTDDDPSGGSRGELEAGTFDLRDEPVVRVELRMEEGAFEIVPGPAEEGVRVFADYDEATYELDQSYGTDKKGVATYKLDFRSKVSFLRRIAQDGSFDDSDMAQNQITVQLPLDTPMELLLNLAKAEADVDLSGLAIAEADLRFRMGEFRMTTDEVNPIEMSRLSARLSMGEFHLDGVSRLRPAQIVTDGAMGEIELDLGGALARDTEIDANMRMGEMRLRLPENAVWSPHGKLRATLGEVSGELENPGDPDPEASPLLTVNGSVFMGELGVSSYFAREGLRNRGRSRH